MVIKTYIIGDIHGCRRPFEELLGILDPDPSRDRLILLGDLFDRGPDSWGVLQIVKKLADDFGERFVLLRGNHEDYLLQPKISFAMKKMWERVGRRTTVRSFKEHGEKMEDCAPWIEEHAVLYYKGDGFSCVHAGLMADPPEANDVYTLVHDHGIVLQNRYAGPLAITGHIALETPAYFAGDEENVIELSENQWRDLPANGIICIDAGCGKGGTLIGMVIEDGRYILYGAEE